MSAQWEAKSLLTSLLMLWLALFFVYIIFFGVHGEKMKQDLDFLHKHDLSLYPKAAFNTASVTTNVQSLWNSVRAEIKEDVAQVQQQAQQALVAQATQTMSQWVSAFDEPGKKFHAVQALFSKESPVSTSSGNTPSVTTNSAPSSHASGIYMLRDTWHWRPELPVAQAGMKSLDYLAISDDGEYILKNMDNTHFVKMTGLPNDLLSNVQRLWWNIVDISDKNTIQQNRLFGDKVRMISTPAYDPIKVIMLVYFADKRDVRYLQVDKPIFEDRKSSLAETFAERYTR